MKRIFFTCFLIFSCALATAQVSKLSELATGKLISFTPISEVNNDIYGYFALFFLDENKYQTSYEYVILDKNLNKVANGEFKDLTYPNVYSRYLSPEKIGEQLILTKRYFRYFQGRSQTLSTAHKILNVNTNELSDIFYVENGQIVEGDRKIEKTFIRDQLKKESFGYPVAIKDGFLFYEVKSPKSKKFVSKLRFYGLNKEKKWEYTFNDLDRNLNLILNDLDAEHPLVTIIDLETKTRRLQKINAESGKMIFSYEIENEYAQYNHIYKAESIENNKTLIVGKFSTYNSAGYNLKRELGVFKIVLDENGKEISKQYVDWLRISDKLKFDAEGKLEGGYKLAAKSYFTFKNGRISILTEKTKPGFNILSGTSNIKTEDFIIFNFNEAFELDQMEILEKDKGKSYFSSDYLYSQYLNDKNDIVFFYRNNKKEENSRKRNWVLGIVTIIDGKINNEIIPISSKEFFILPYVAKEGFILLREFNENEAYNQIRLERLNY